MRVLVLHVPDCPNAGVLMSRLEQSLPGTTRIETRVVRDQHEAATLGMLGSPTLLIDGVDPFAVAGQSTSVSCRLYVDESGAVSGAPSVTQLRGVLANLGR